VVGEAGEAVAGSLVTGGVPTAAGSLAVVGAFCTAPAASGFCALFLLKIPKICHPPSLGSSFLQSFFH
jgi:hypothetical protein